MESTATLGSIDSSVEAKKSLAIASWTFNMEDMNFRHLFPHICEVRHGWALVRKSYALVGQDEG